MWGGKKWGGMGPAHKTLPRPGLIEPFFGRTPYGCLQLGIPILSWGLDYGLMRLDFHRVS